MNRIVIFIFCFFISLSFGRGDNSAAVHVNYGHIDADVSGNVNVNEKSFGEKIGDQLEERVQYYEKRFGTDKAWGLALNEISQQAKITPAQAYTAYYRDRCQENALTPTEIKTKVSKVLNGKIIKNDPFDIFFNASMQVSKENTIAISVKTNMPEEMYLGMKLSHEKENIFFEAESVYVRNGEMKMEIKAPSIKKGRYFLDITDDAPACLYNQYGFENSKTKDFCGKYTFDNKFTCRKNLRAIKIKSINIPKDLQASATEIAIVKNGRKKVLQQMPNIVDSRNNKVYKAVKIGKHIWMAENLNYPTANSLCYDNSETNCSKYGRLYAFDDAITACPTGTHLPSIEEFKDLYETVHGRDTKKGIIDSTSWKYTKGNNDYGFSALPAGSGAVRKRTGFTALLTKEKYDFDFRDLGETTSFWSSEKAQNNYDIRCMYLGSSQYRQYDYISIDRCNKDRMYSVRCVKD